MIQNLVLYQDKYAFRVNQEGDVLFYYFDYDAREADKNMQFQHFHPFFEICIMLCPVSTHFLEGKPYRLQALDIFVIPPNALHKTMYPAGDPSKRLIIQFNLPQQAAGLPDECRQLRGFLRQMPSVFRFEPELQRTVYQKLNDIFLLGKKTEAMRNLSIHCCFTEFLTLLYLNRDKNIYTNQAENADVDNKIYSVAGYIHGHFSENLSLELLSQRFYVSSYHLSRQFKKVTGFTLTDYIQMTRIRNTQAMLINTGVPITEAAGLCGFCSFSQFNRTFRKHIGMSPSQYRRQYKLAGSEAERQAVQNEASDAAQRSVQYNETPQT